MSVEAHVRPHSMDRQDPLQQTESLPSVLSRLMQKRDLLAQGNPAHAEIRPALIVDGGGMRGAVGAGALMQLADRGLSTSFDLAIGLSAGAADTAYFVGGNTTIGEELYCSALATRKFINKANLFNPFSRRPVMDFDYLQSVLEGPQGIDQEAIRASRTEYYVGVTNRNGEGELLDMKQQPDMVQALLASCAMPVGYGKPIRLRDHEGRERPFGDGEIGNGLPLAFAIEQGCTDILLVRNSPLPERISSKAPLYERALLQLLMSGYPAAFRNATIERRRRYWETINGVSDTFNLQIIAPERNTVGRLTINGAKLKEAINSGRKAVEQVIYQNQPAMKMAA